MKIEIKEVRDLLNYTLIFMFIVNFISSLFIIFVNPETWFFNFKLNGSIAIIWLLVNSLLGLLVCYLVFLKYKLSYIFSFLYFLFNFLALMFFGISYFYLAGLIISILLVYLENFY